MENNFIEICRTDELEENRGKRFILENTEVALFKVRDEIFAVSNICPHQHSKIIYDGIIEDEYVVCPAHGWMFNLKTGKQPTGAAGLQVYPVKILNGKVFIKLLKKELKW
jgi:NAD(P)H-dependent nitrite reductase small subunit